MATMVPWSRRVDPDELVTVIASRIPSEVMENLIIAVPSILLAAADEG